MITLKKAKWIIERALGTMDWEDWSVTILDDDPDSGMVNNGNDYIMIGDNFSIYGPSEVFKGWSLEIWEEIPQTRHEPSDIECRMLVEDVTLSAVIDGLISAIFDQQKECAMEEIVWMEDQAEEKEIEKIMADES